MAVKSLIKRSEYHDSVSLMLVAKELAKFPGIDDAAVIMATEANKEILEIAGLLTSEAKSASPNDLLIAVKGSPEILDQALSEAEKLLQKRVVSEGFAKSGYQSKTLRGALKSNPGPNIAVISVAGRYAADEAWEALHQGLHVLLFSDNVSQEDEIALKKYASQAGLLLMGPGAGTAILNGVALGFANVVPRGPVGIVSAAGTGLQEVSTLLAKNSVGITQGIGTGGRDLKQEVGGIMMLEGLKALQADADTQVIVLIGKPPAASVTTKVLDQIASSAKPVVVGFMGGDIRSMQVLQNVYPARTLEDTALIAARLAGADVMNLEDFHASQERELAARAIRLRRNLSTEQRWLRGLFSGGTLCYETQVICCDLLKEPVWSNAPLDKENQLPNALYSHGHCVVDLGEEEFTVGRPHPMIDNDLRIRRIYQEVKDPETAVILLDVVLGYGAHPDPASELGLAIRTAKQAALDAGRELLVIASITGTDADPQCLSRQAKALEDAGVVVCTSNAEAAKLAAMVVAIPV